MNSPIPVAQGHIARPIVRDPRQPSRRAQARGFTLVEILVALAITLIMMGAVVTLFGVISQSVAESRSAIEMSDRLRAARNQLQLDLGGATATMQPPLRPENDEGYLEIIEGPVRDSDPYYLSNVNLSLFGDVDDVLMFTTRSRGAPYLGKWNNTVIESPVAEVVYFLAQDPTSLPPVIDATTNPPTRLYTLYRRVLLVAPSAVLTNPTPPVHFFDVNDISIRYEEPGGTPTLLANTLGDLTKRENRFAHHGTTMPPAVDYGTFPFPVDLTAVPVIPPGAPTTPSLPNNWPMPPGMEENAFIAPAVDFRVGDDVLLNNVLAFDVQVWDPGAPVFVSNGVAVEPRDPGWAGLTGGTPAGFGAYVDMGYSGAIVTAPNMVFNLINPNSKSGFTSGPTAPRVYDTWSLHYENDGVDQDNDMPTLTDEGTNGLDDDSDGVVDELDELETLPPYSAPLRGIRVTIRVYEPSSQQVREAVVIQDFLPE
ncbi:MAG: type II secretion system protein [Pirellulales bacterium]